MTLKNYTIKAYCNSCGQLIHNGKFLVNIDLVTDNTYLEKLLYSHFPTIKCCQRCESKDIARTYSYLTHKSLITPPDDAELITRAKDQIAATYDFDNNMSAAERIAVREAFQKQLDQLLTKNNISK